MTFLELVQELWRESGSGGSKPVSVVSAQGEAERLAYWVRRADVEVQQEHTDWTFRWAQESGTTTTARSYSFPEDLESMDENTLLYDGSPMEVCKYLEVRGEAEPTSSGNPYRAVIMPDKTLRFDPAPAAGSTYAYDYYIKPIKMDIENASESIIPEEYRLVIVARALLLYAQYENAPELIPQAQLMYQSNLKPLEASYLPGDREMHQQAEGNDFVMYVE